MVMADDVFGSPPDDAEPTTVQTGVAEVQPQQLRIAVTFSLAGLAGDAVPVEQASPREAGRKTRRGFRCGECGECFGAEADLDQHPASHSKTAPHSCEVCGKKFRDASSFGKHKRIHREAKLYDSLKKYSKFEPVSVYESMR